MKKNILLLLLLLSTTYNKSLAQSSFPVYSDTGYHYLTAQKMIMNNDGSFVVLATIDLNFDPLHSFGFVVSKYAPTGLELWTRSFNTFPAGSPSTIMYATDMVRSIDTGYIIIADSTTSLSTVIDANALNMYKLDENGNTVWETTDFNPSTNAYGFLSYITKSNISAEYVVVNYDSISKFSNSGNLMGEVTNPGIYFSIGVSDEDSVLGAKYSGGPAGLLIMDSNANVSHTSPLANSTLYDDIQLTSDSCWLLTGIDDTSATGGYIYLSKFTYHGSPIWQHAYLCNDQSQSVISTTEYNGKYYITTSQQDCMFIDAASGACVGPTSLVVICTDTMGNQLSILTIAGNASNYDSVRSYIGLQSAVIADTLYTLGTAEWSYMTSSPIAGISANSSSYIVWKNALTAFTPLHANNLSKNEKLQLFPDPASDELNLIAGNMSGMSVDIYINNIEGQEVLHERKTSFSDMTINIKNIPTGMYVLNICNNGNNIFRNKFIIMKH